MLGRDHMLLAGVAGVALPPLLSPQSVSDPLALAVGAVIVTGFGLLPDIDEPNSLISRKLGFVSQSVSRVTNKLAGGHRQLTHSLPFVALVWGGVWLLDSRFTTWTTCIMFVAAASFAIKALLPYVLRKIHLVTFIIVIGGGYWGYVHPISPLWLATLAGGGTALHLVGDILTVEGVPLLYPMRWRLRIPLVGHTSSMRESILGAILAVVFLVMFSLNVLKPELTSVDAGLKSGVGQIPAKIQHVISEHKLPSVSAGTITSDIASVQRSIVTVEGWLNKKL